MCVCVCVCVCVCRYWDCDDPMPALLIHLRIANVDAMIYKYIKENNDFQNIQNMTPEQMLMISTMALPGKWIALRQYVCIAMLQCIDRKMNEITISLTKCDIILANIRTTKGCPDDYEHANMGDQAIFQEIEDRIHSIMCYYGVPQLTDGNP